MRKAEQSCALAWATLPGYPLAPTSLSISTQQPQSLAQGSRLQTPDSSRAASPLVLDSALSFKTGPEALGIGLGITDWLLSGLDF